MGNVSTAEKSIDRAKFREKLTQFWPSCYQIAIYLKQGNNNSVAGKLKVQYQITAMMQTKTRDKIIPSDHVSCDKRQAYYSDLRWNHQCRAKMT